MKCSNCGEEFEGRADAKYCSVKCRVSHHRISVTDVTDNLSVTEEDVTDNGWVLKSQADILYRLLVKRLIQRGELPLGSLTGDEAIFGNTKIKTTAQLARAVSKVIPSDSSLMGEKTRIFTLKG